MNFAILVVYRLQVNDPPRIDVADHSFNFLQICPSPKSTNSTEASPHTINHPMNVDNESAELSLRFILLQSLPDQEGWGKEVGLLFHVRLSVPHTVGFWFLGGEGFPVCGRLQREIESLKHP
jgi:hypothetical protein